MPEAVPPRSEFAVSGLSADTFQVARFTGRESLAGLYEFETFLAASGPGPDPEAVQSGRATLTVRRPSGCDIFWHGIVREFDQLERNHGLTYYRAVLVPRAWWLTQTLGTRIFLDADLTRVLDSVFREAGLQQGLDLEFRLRDTYSRREWICQYAETGWNFASRLMERAGVYCFFEQEADREKLVITDTFMSHMPLGNDAHLAYRPASGLTDAQSPEHARTFRRCFRQTPRGVRVQGYNYRTCKTLQATRGVVGHGQVQVYAHEDDPRTNTEAERMAKVRAESLNCRRALYHGSTTAPFLRPGCTFRLLDHYDESFNREYLVVEVVHECRQESALSTRGLQDVPEQTTYRNDFAAIPSNVQFRAEIATPRPKVSGPLTAWIDGEGDGHYAEVDALGRYKVRFAMDLSDREGGKASHWIRLITPYAGEGHGLHLPLHKGAEVLVLFRNGNPDKPVIAGAVANQAQKMVVNQDSSTQCRLTTAGGNLLHVEDRDGSQRFLIQSPVQNSWVRIGAPNDPPPPPDWDWSSLPTKDGIALATGGSFSVNCQVWNTVTLGEQSSTVVGAKAVTVLGEALNVNLGPRQDVIIPRKTDFTPARSGIRAAMEYLHLRRAVVVGGQDQALIVDQQQVLGQQNNVVGGQQQVVAQQDNVVVDQQQLLANNNNVIGDQQQLVAQQDNVVADQQLIVANNNNIVAENNNVVVNQENVVVEQNNQLVEVNNIVVNQNNVVQEQANLGVVQNNVVADVNFV
ncbi:Actin cross-linking toxin VgrG1 [Fundidesulfovibrio magnetotacticus]|uniref:Actin cross-linking toxin VgrG1 n=1 Tax=Fundidesulfovibrio magnetotacticus TaxID=2730080 RepID=A0A6V8LT09_9BACT|nr:type VI secretion system tip protein TssI/VgrG [Fundidesulfovibrio magnetotacticus]GFK93458.1 Actin cross-linking toxin VgrG1 [Fundidesulfovibrio magnetotacticus]